MRIGILGDIHGNLEALEAVLNHARDLEIDQWIQLGDIVGYGPNPKECIAAVQELSAVVVAGNHDWAVTRRISDGTFNPVARAAVAWTREQLDEEETDFLDSLPLVAFAGESLTCFHGSLVEPSEFHYITTLESAWENLNQLGTGLGFYGHSHIPVIYALSDQFFESSRPVLDTQSIQSALINPGSVGQPRDGNPKAAYGILDQEDGRYELVRCEYEVHETIRKIELAGLPEYLGERLLVGE